MAIRDWSSSLPDLAIFDIATRLNPIEFAAFAGVCKSWRSLCKEFKDQINGHHPPLLFLPDCSRRDSARRRSTPVLEVYSFPDKRVYYKTLPPEFLTPESRPFGCFHGYIVMGSTTERKLHLANPFTEELIWMPMPIPKYPSIAILTAPPGTPGSTVVAFTWTGMMTCRPCIDDRWSVLSLSTFVPENYRHRFLNILQVIFFKGRVYILVNGIVVMVEFEVEPELYVKNSSIFTFEMSNGSDLDDPTPFCFFAGDEELFLLQLELQTFPKPSQIIKAFKLQDHDKGTWEMIEHIGDRTLFGSSCSGFVPRCPRVTGWEQVTENRVFLVHPCYRFQVGAIPVPCITDMFVPRFKYRDWLPPSLFL